MKKTSILAALLLSFSLTAFAKEQMNPDAQAINTACAQEAATANCGQDKVGTGLLICMHAYKKEHKKDFKFSEGCRAAMKKWNLDRKHKRK